MSLLFAQGLCVFLWNFLSCVAAEPLCKEEEYSVGDQCCPMCNPDMGLVTWRECSSREDTVCRCIPGFFCETQEGDHCTTRLPLTNCSLGQRVLERGASVMVSSHSSRTATQTDGTPFYPATLQGHRLRLCVP
uniref:tumor necrosis factor receptor superfamily member 14-like n=1 Tax=Myodes glareolus TaxID=447135 RepID=UPI00202296CF|nr:tumor necrosis factor receptor superfamily member 14-like [Myodes glareolus]